MININITVDSTETIGLLERLNEKNKNWKQELIDIGSTLLRSFDLNFTEQGRPIKWVQSERAKKRGGMTLVDTGRLRSSSTVIAYENNIFEVTEKTLNAGSDLEYAKYLQADRPFIMLQEQDYKEIENIMIKGIDEIL